MASFLILFYKVPKVNVTPLSACSCAPGTCYLHVKPITYWPRRLVPGGAAIVLQGNAIKMEILCCKPSTLDGNYYGLW